MPEEETPDNNSYDKPGFDGRLQYYKLVGQYMTAIANYQSNHNYKPWLDNINGLFDLVIAFIKIADAKNIKVKINKIELLIDTFSASCINKNNQIVLDRKLEQELHDLTQDLYIASKHMLLPIQESEDTEYSSEDFFKGSDL